MIADQIFKVPNIIARVNDPEKSYFYHKLGINTINPIQYEIEILKSKLPFKNLDVITSIDDNYQILELLVSKEKTVSIGDIEVKYHCIISGRMKEGVAEIPGKNDFLHNGDRIFCTVHKKEKGNLVNYLCKENFL
jgi:trk system potassium uptake protein TrkA